LRHGRSPRFRWRSRSRSRSGTGGASRASARWRRRARPAPGPGGAGGARRSRSGLRQPGAGDREELPGRAGLQVRLHVVYRIQQAVPARVGGGERGALAPEPRADARRRPDRMLVRPRLNPQQPEQQVVSLPGPEPLVPGVDLVPRPAAGAEHAGAMSRRDRERPLELRAREVLRAVALDHAQRAGAPREDGRLGEQAVHDEPLVRAEPHRAPFAQLLFEGDASALDRATRRFESAAGLSSLVSRHIDQLEPARLERRADRGPQSGSPASASTACTARAVSSTSSAPATPSMSVRPRLASGTCDTGTAPAATIASLQERGAAMATVSSAPSRGR